MTPTAQDFKEECNQIRTLLKDKHSDIFNHVTLFKDWTIGDIIGHLHVWNIAADLALNDPEAFQTFISDVIGQLNSGKSHPQFQKTFLAR